MARKKRGWFNDHAGHSKAAKKGHRTRTHYTRRKKHGKKRR